MAALGLAVLFGGLYRVLSRSSSLGKGSNLTKMTEALHVTTAIRSGASLVHGVQM
jgi:hypothetical protein